MIVKMFYADVDVNKQGLRAGEIINIRKAVFLHNKETVGDRFALFFCLSSAQLKMCQSTSNKVEQLHIHVKMSVTSELRDSRE